MSTYYEVACHTCQVRKDLSGYTREYVAKFAGEWCAYEHISHEVTVLHDVTGWDEDYDELCDRVSAYESI
ncbi:hypothetical protein ANTHOS_123 [Bacillus phage Anthos]|uniref:Uncharacterized protein n=2 Tax=Bequatrovirus troll TaxID=1918009 RepID=A0A7U3T8Q6_9CAUD|nr:hypothetical protein JUGLONE_125 [Bacillus phage Juglone]QPY77360.1 hypothetical protein ANTHOS_123 [Bacillus phage Anthos]